MDMIAFAVVVLAVFAQVAAIAGFESRDGFDTTRPDSAGILED